VKKPRRKRNKKHNKTPKQPKPPTSGPTTQTPAQGTKFQKLSFSGGWQIFLAFFTLVTGVATLVGLYLTIISRISVYPSAALDEKDPFHTTFILENQSYLPICSVNISTHLLNVKYGGDLTIENGNTSDYRENFPVLAPGKRTTIGMHSFPNLIGAIPKPESSVTEATSELVVTYRPLFGFRRAEQRFMFRFAKTQSGELLWLPVER
jgi:hypothetical protein